MHKLRINFTLLELWTRYKSPVFFALNVLVLLVFSARLYSRKLTSSITVLNPEETSKAFGSVHDYTALSPVFSKSQLQCTYIYVHTLADATIVGCIDS